MFSISFLFCVNPKKNLCPIANKGVAIRPYFATISSRADLSLLTSLFVKAIPLAERNSFSARQSCQFGEV